MASARSRRGLLKESLDEANRICFRIPGIPIPFVKVAA